MIPTICSLSLTKRVRELSHRTANVLAQLLAALPAFDASNEWIANGSASCAHWLAHEMQTELCTARDYLRVAKKLTELMLSTRVTPNASADAWPSIAQQRSDALLRLINTGGASTDTEIILHLRGDANTLDNGTPLTDHDVARLIDAAFIRALIHNTDGKPIDATHRRRYPTTRQKRVVKETYPSCIDCGRHELLTYDHVPNYHTSHRTIVAELQPRCWPCHRKRHTEG